jgi:hypothetical protein
MAATAFINSSSFPTVQMFSNQSLFSPSGNSIIDQITSAAATRSGAAVTASSNTTTAFNPFSQGPLGTGTGWSPATAAAGEFLQVTPPILSTATGIVVKFGATNFWTTWKLQGSVSATNISWIDLGQVTGGGTVISCTFINPNQYATYRIINGIATAGAATIIYFQLYA